MVILYIATSLDGFIADEDGGVGWIPPAPEGEDFGYNDFYASCSHTVQGGNTYRQVLTFGEWPYPSTHNVVVSKTAEAAHPTVEVVNQNPMEKLRQLRDTAEKHVWLIGGGDLNGQALAAGLIDEVWQFVMPVNLGRGIPLFGGHSAPERPVEILERKELPRGGFFVKYRP